MGEIVESNDDSLLVYIKSFDGQQNVMKRIL